MLFIGGGNDPIVQPKEILDASPEEGITMLSIANLTHFLDTEPRSGREVEQREFWLPEAAGLIARSAERAAELRTQERVAVEKTHEAIEAWEESSEEGERKLEAPQAREPKDRDLSSPTFEEALDWVIDGVLGDDSSTSGWLFVCRNLLPAAFLGPEMHRAFATGLHHHDVAVQAYALGLARHAAWLRDIKSRVTLVLPSSLHHNFVNVSSEMVDPHSDAPGYQLSADVREEAWQTFLEVWGDNVRWLDAGPIGHPLLPTQEDAPYERFARTFTKGETGKEDLPLDYFQVAHLPDVWISVNAHQFLPDREPTDKDGAIWRFVEWLEATMGDVQIRLRSGKTTQEALDKSPIGSALRTGKVRMVRVSGTELNPRYRGRFEQSPSQVLQVLAHCASALIRSTEEPKEL